MTDEMKAQAMKRLMEYPEWKTFELHIKEVAKVHCESSVKYSCKGNAVDAQRQAWISEGLIEAIEEPDSVVQEQAFRTKTIVGRASEMVKNVFGKK